MSFLFAGLAVGVAGVTGFYLFNKWIAGGVCMSQARLDGKTVIITGANTGIGLETAVDLAKRNARVILACRSVERGETAAVKVRKRSDNDNVVFRQLDLASLDSVRQFSANILKEEPRIDILINNAGVCNSTYLESSDGFELTFGVNHLGHFLLTNLLLDRLKEAPSSRIVNVGALLYKLHKEYSFNDINSKDSSRFFITSNRAYIQSKLANVLFTLGLHKRLKGTNVTTNILHPGVIKTDLLRNFLPKLPKAIRVTLEAGMMRPFLKSVEQGAQTTIHCAVSEELEGMSGRYFSNCRDQGIHTQATTDEVIERLWELSCQWSGISDSSSSS